MRLFAVAITDGTHIYREDLAFFLAPSRSIARKQANEYRKLWGIKAKIAGVVLSPRELEADDYARREYAADELNRKNARA